MLFFSLLYMFESGGMTFPQILTFSIIVKVLILVQLEKTVHQVGCTILTLPFNTYNSYSKTWQQSKKWNDHIDES